MLSAAAGRYERVTVLSEAGIHRSKAGGLRRLWGRLRRGVLRRRPAKTRPAAAAAGRGAAPRAGKATPRRGGGGAADGRSDRRICRTARRDDAAGGDANDGHVEDRRAG